MKFFKQLTALFHQPSVTPPSQHQRLDTFLNLPQSQACVQFPELAWVYHLQSVAFRIFCDATDTGLSIPSTLMRNAQRAHALAQAILKQWDKPDARKSLEQRICLTQARTVRVAECLAIRQDIQTLQDQALEEGDAFSTLSQQRYLSWCALYFDDTHRSLLRFKALLHCQTLIEQAGILAPIYFNRTEEAVLPLYLAEQAMRMLAWDVPLWQSWELETLLKQLSESKTLRGHTVESMTHEIQQQREAAKAFIRQQLNDETPQAHHEKHTQLCQHLKALHQVY